MLASLHLDQFYMPYGVKNALRLAYSQNECCITSSGTEIIVILRAVDIDARSYPGPFVVSP